MILTFDLLTPKPNQFNSVPWCTIDKSLMKSINTHHRYYQTSQTNGRTHKHRQTTKTQCLYMTSY